MECGAQLEFEEVESEPDSSVSNNSYIYDLGEKMEEAVEQIFTAKGYNTKRRQRIKGKSDTINEIDIIAHKKRIKIAIECKNYSTPIGQSQIRDFKSKLEEIKINNGYFVSNSDFTSGATKYAQQHNITLWSKEDVMEEHWNINIGRAKTGQEFQIKNALPLRINYHEATKLELENPQHIQIESSSLYFKPYFVIEYQFKAKYSDPTRTKHEFTDQGQILIDALDGTILNKYNMLGRLKQLISNSDEEIEYQVKNELEHFDKTENYRITADPFTVNIMEPNIQTRFVKKLAVDFITEKNTKQIPYTPKSAETVFETKIATYVPKRKDILIKKVNFLYVPKWKIQFQSLNHNYTREMYGYTGNKIEDTIEYCPEHTSLGNIRIVSKKNQVVCEVCGKALCSEHISQCPVCGKWICLECGVTCSNCSKIYCSDHINHECEIEHKPICNDCSRVCPICGKTYASKYEVKCDECGTLVCKNCTQTKGLLRRKRLCSNCLNF